MSKAEEALKQRKTKQAADAELVAAYRAVMGRPGKRSAAQQKVMASLQKQLEAPSFYAFNPDGSRLILDHTTAALNEGARSFILNLKAMVDGPLPQTEDTTQ
jgi:hypothetical protein